MYPEIKLNELVSDCHGAFPRVEVDDIEWNDIENGICSECGTRCEYVPVEVEGDVSVPVDTLNMLYEQTGGAFGSDPDAYGRAVEAEYQRLNSAPFAQEIGSAVLMATSVLTVGMFLGYGIAAVMGS